MRLHAAIARSKFDARGGIFLNQMEGWFDRLVAANACEGTLDKQALKKLLGTRWFFAFGR